MQMHRKGAKPKTQRRENQKTWKNRHSERTREESIDDRSITQLGGFLASTLKTRELFT